MPTIKVEVWIHSSDDGVWASGSSEIKMDIPVKIVRNINFDGPVHELIEAALVKLEQNTEKELEKRAQKAQREMEGKAFDAEGRTE